MAKIRAGERLARSLHLSRFSGDVHSEPQPCATKPRGKDGNNSIGPSEQLLSQFPVLSLLSPSAIRAVCPSVLAAASVP